MPKVRPVNTNEEVTKLDITNLFQREELSNHYAYELHLHTLEFGWCAHVPAKVIVPAYEDAGYSGIVVTNHYFKHGFDAMPEENWAGKIDNYLRGYEAAVSAVSREDFTVMLGLELRFLENNNDYLVYGITKEELIEYPRLYEHTPESFIKLANERNWLVIQAHPYRRGCIVAHQEHIHGIEVYNENPRHDSKNSDALAYAKKHSLIMTAGSDYHQRQDLAQAAVVFNRPIKDAQDLVLALREGLAVDYAKTDKEDIKKATLSPNHVLISINA